MWWLVGKIISATLCRFETYWATFCYNESLNDILKNGEKWFKVAKYGWKRLFFSDTFNHFASRGSNWRKGAPIFMFWVYIKGDRTVFPIKPLEFTYLFYFSITYFLFINKTKVIYQIKAIDEVNKVMGNFFLIYRRKKNISIIYQNNWKNTVLSKIFL